MADNVDMAQHQQEQIEEVRRRKENGGRYIIPPGTEGECETCGEWSGRLVQSMCAPCRDKYDR
jgi:hypothetical protein